MQCDLGLPVMKYGGIWIGEEKSKIVEFPKIVAKVFLSEWGLN